MKILDVPQSGSVAGVTSSRNRFGQYRRTRAIPTNPGTSFQATVRARMQTVADAWKALTATQRQGWADLGLQFARNDALGQSYDLTGFGAYVSLNLSRLAAGDAVLTDAPVFNLPAAMTTLTPTITSASYSIAYTPTPLGAGEKLFIFAGPQRSAGVGYESDYRLISVSAAAAASPFVVLTSYQARFGTPVTGNRIFTKAQRYSGGFMSTPIVTSTIVA